MNPWLRVPAADYEAHMVSVGQLQALGHILAEDLDWHRPQALVVAGCATGNGFEHIDPAITTRVVAVDINPTYLAIVAERHARRLPGLELLACDLPQAELDAGAFDLVHAALILEYVDPEAAMARFAGWLRPGGVLTVVLQEPGATPAVGRTPFRSLLVLESLMELVPPARVRAAAAAQGLDATGDVTLSLPGGKSFAVLRFRKEHASMAERPAAGESAGSWSA